MSALGPARGFGAPLWCMEPSWEAVRTIMRDARRAVPWTGDAASTIRRQPWLRRVAREADRMLAAAHIYVEGAGQ